MAIRYTVEAFSDLPASAPLGATGWTREDEREWTFGASGWVEQPSSGGGGAFELDDLSDVNAPAPADGDVVTWIAGSGQWEAQAPTGGTGSVSFASTWKLGID